jgi:crotonobetainyl-CoA:carnitine CoA-transferase CaiB-like acyl-CoA transferase
VTGPLSGVRVLDLTSLLPGPYASLLLADMGADVVKIESRIGDLLRQVPPTVDGQGAYYLSLNRNKRSLGLDLRKPAGRDVFFRLAASADVILEGFRPGRAERMGVGPEALLAANPRLIYCSLSGFGQTGPDNRRAGHDATYLARAGVLGAAGAPDSRPALPAIQVADMAAGTAAAYAVAAALFQRERTGAGDRIDIAILDSIAAWMSVHLEAHHAGAASVSEALPLSGRYPFYNVYATRDGGYVALGALEPLFWRDFCLAVGRPDLAAAQFVAGEARAELFRTVQAIFAGRDTAEWRALIQASDLAAEVVASVEEVAADPQLRARGMVLTLPREVGAPLVQLDTPVRMRGRPANPGRRPPRLGEHSRSILTEVLDLSRAEIDNLVGDGAVFEESRTGRQIAPDALP